MDGTWNVPTTLTFVGCVAARICKKVCPQVDQVDVLCPLGPPKQSLSQALHQQISVAFWAYIASRTNLKRTRHYNHSNQSEHGDHKKVDDQRKNEFSLMGSTQRF